MFWVNGVDLNRLLQPVSALLPISLLVFYLIRIFTVPILVIPLIRGVLFREVSLFFVSISDCLPQRISYRFSLWYM